MVVVLLLRLSELPARHKKSLPTPSQSASPTSFELPPMTKAKFLKMHESEFHLVLLPQDPLSDSFLYVCGYMKIHEVNC